MSYNATSIGWQWVVSLVVIVAGLLRLASYINRRRSRSFRSWEPAEIVLIRSLAVLITGRPATKINWKLIDALLLAILLLALVRAW